AREVGGALGVAIMGSVAASAYAARLGSAATGLDPAAAHRATESLTGALSVVDRLRGPAANTLATTARNAFDHGFHVAAVGLGAAGGVVTAVVVRQLPKVAPVDGKVEIVALEPAAEAAIPGLPLPALPVDESQHAGMRADLR